MRTDSYPLPLPSPLATGVGAPLPCADLTEITVYVSGTFVGSIQIEVSADGDDWFSLGAPLTTRGMLVAEVAAGGRFRADMIRANLTYTSGTPEVVIMGGNLRTDGA